MYLAKQTLALVAACLCTGSAFSAGFSMPHTPSGKSCPTAVEKNGNTTALQTDADPRKNVLDNKKAGNALQVNTQIDMSKASHGTGGGGGAGKTQATVTPAQKPAANAQ